MSVDEQRVYRSGQFSISGGERRSLRMGYDAEPDGHAIVYRLARARPAYCGVWRSTRLTVQTPIPRPHIAIDRPRRRIL
jgi:hypothetical protein